ncbi:MAG: hypothetical protein JWO36_6455 [Myxococcales bacterium]|nr:hypothetical protein [Myxococcales bacterium]
MSEMISAPTTTSGVGMQVRQSVLVAATLVDQYRIGVQRILGAWKQPDAGDDMSTMRADLERSYVAIWEQLDAAAKLTRSAGRNVASYDQIRSTPGLEVNVAVANVSEVYLGTEIRGASTYAKFEATVTHNGQGVSLARTAVSALQAAWPELDWAVADEPVVDLRPGGFGRIVLGLSRLFGRRASR